MASDHRRDTPDPVPPYQALSYVWGREDATKSITLRDTELSHVGRTVEEYSRLVKVQMQPRTFYVRPNLYKALKRLRDEHVNLWFWIDAICINQADDTEKAHQIPKMLKIYCNALNVCVWLGEPDTETGSASLVPGAGSAAEESHPLDFVADLVDLGTLDYLVSDEGIQEETTIRCWLAFARLLRNDWFRRRWVIQEVAAASHASVMYGNRTITWIDFSDAVELFMTKVERIRVLLEKQPGRTRELQALRHVELVGARDIVNSSNNLLRMTNDGGILDRALTAEELVMAFRHFQVTNRRDTVYALLPLASDGHVSTAGNRRGADAEEQQWCAMLTPNYGKSTLDVYVDFVRHCVASSNSLDIICRNWAIPLAESEGPRGGRKGKRGNESRRRRLPSWIREVGNSPLDGRAAQTGRLEADSLVGMPGQRIYNASRGRTACVSFGSRGDGSNDGNVAAGGGSVAPAQVATRPKLAVEKGKGKEADIISSSSGGVAESSTPTSSPSNRDNNDEEDSDGTRHRLRGLSSQRASSSDGSGTRRRGSSTAPSRTTACAWPGGTGPRRARPSTATTATTTTTPPRTS